VSDYAGKQDGLSREQPLREPNILLDALIDEAGMSHDGLAARVNQAGKRQSLVLLYDHASVRRWIRDATVPRGQVPDLICEILSARLRRTITLSDVGLDRYSPDDEGWTAPSFPEAVTSGKVETRDIKETASR
jgi:hypothetical protein